MSFDNIGAPQNILCSDKFSVPPFTDRQTSAALANERQATICSLLSGWVWETDPEHRFTYMSESVLRFAGRPPEWHYGRTRDEIGNTCDPDQFAEFIRKLDAREAFSCIEFTRRETTGPVQMRTTGQPYYRNGKFRGYRGIAYRISEEAQERKLRRIAELETLEIASTLQAVVANYPFPIIVFDANLRLLFANDQYYDTIGFTKTDIPIGVNHQVILQKLIERGELRGGTNEEIVARHINFAKQGEPFSLQRSRATGQVLQVHGFPLPCGGFARTIVDVTEQTEAQWTIASLRDKLRTIASISLSFR